MLSVMLPAVFDAAATAFAVYLISEYVLTRFIKGAGVIIVSALFAAGAMLVAFSLSKRRAGKIRSSKTAKKSFYQRMYNLYLCTDDEIGAIFSAVLRELDICATVSGRHMSLADGTKVCAPLLPDPLTQDEIVREHRSDPNNKLIVISSSFSPAAVSLASSIGVKLVSAETFARFLDEKGLLATSADEIKKPALKERLSVFFYRKSGRRFLLYGVFLCAVSRLVFYPVYYLVTGTIFIVYGLIAAFFGRGAVANNTDNLKELFDKNKV